MKNIVWARAIPARRLWESMIKMRKFVIAIVFLPVVLISALPVSNMLLNEARLWVFAKQLSELDGLFQRDFELLATGSEVYRKGNDETCGFRAARLYSHYETDESIAAINSYLDSKNFVPARKRADDGPAEKYVVIADGHMAVTIEDGEYWAWFDIRCW